MAVQTTTKEQFISFASDAVEDVSEKQQRVQIDESVTSPVVL